VFFFSFSHSWLALGHCCSEEDESDSAIIAYRTCARLFPSQPWPWLCMGKQYVRTRNLALAQQHISYAVSLAPSDPRTLHEQGVLLYEQANFEAAASTWEQAVSAWSQKQHGENGRGTNHVAASMSNFRITGVTGINGYHEVEVTIFNLGHAMRKMKRLSDALKWYNRFAQSDPV
jgi:tetratricopeptide (TPR) repeat protein